jgi:hypothetical protein
MIGFITLQQSAPSQMTYIFALTALDVSVHGQGTADCALSAVHALGLDTLETKQNARAKKHSANLSVVFVRKTGEESLIPCPSLRRVRSPGGTQASAALEASHGNLIYGCTLETYAHRVCTHPSGDSISQA